MKWRSVLGQCLPHMGWQLRPSPCSHLTSDSVFAVLPTQRHPCFGVFLVSVIPVLPGVDLRSDTEQPPVLGTGAGSSSTASGRTNTMGVV